MKLAVFRSRDDGLAERLGRENVGVLEYPLIDWIPLREHEDALYSRWQDLTSGAPGYLLFTSIRAVNRFAEIVGIIRINQFRLSQSPSQDHLEFQPKFDRIISVGLSTTTQLMKFGLFPRYRVEMGGKGVSEDGYKEGEEGQKGAWQLIHNHKLSPIIHVRPARIDSFLEEQLRAHGYIYEPFIVYETLPITLTEKEKAGVMASDYLFFSSGSIVEAFYNNFGKETHPLPPVILIGESTRKTYRRFFPSRKQDILLQGSRGEELSERLLKTLERIDKTNNG